MILNVKRLIIFFKECVFCKVLFYLYIHFSL
nr:MAG TPA: hypothetical protein [Caudoviricetes sp.]